MKTPLLRLLEQVRPYWKGIALSVTAGLLAIAANVGLIATSAYLISAAALRPSVADLQVAIVGVRFFGISRGLFRYLERLSTHSVNFRILAGLRVWLFQKLEPLAPAGLIDKRGGDLLARLIADVESLEQFYVRAVAPPVIAAVASALVWFWLRAFDPAIANTLLAFFVLVGVLLPVLVRFLSRKPGQRVVAARAALQAALIEALQGMPDLIVSNRQSDYAARIHTLNADLTRVQDQSAWVAALQTGLSTLGVHVGVWVILILGIGLVQSGQTPGVLLAMLVLASLAAFEIVLPLPVAAQVLESSQAAASRLYEIADQPAPVRDQPTIRTQDLEDLAQPPAICLRGVSFRYAPELPFALHDIDLDVPAGKSLAMVGPSGAGKTTLFQILLRFWDYTEGEIFLGNIELREAPAEWARRQFSVGSPAGALFNTTLRQNLLLANPRADQAQLTRAARLAQIEPWIESLPEGYDTWIGENGYRLSGGERQRLILARAILRSAPALLLDEPTAHLNPQAERAFFQKLPEIRAGRTTIVITHQLAYLDGVDEIAVLRSGQITERGSHAELIQLRGYYWKMWQRQRDIIEAGDFLPT